MSVQRKIGILLLVLLIAVLLGSWLVWRSTPVLTVGIFAGSNWGVPQGEPYAIIDRTIEKFEEAHPGVRVQYVSGIQREDYAEWLAGQFLQGGEPDVFLLPTEDFALYAERGALYDLTPLMESDADFSAEVYDGTAFRNGQYEERSYALPCENMITLMFVNKTLLAREGLAMPPRRIRTGTACPTNSAAMTTHGNRRRCPTACGSFARTARRPISPTRAWRRRCAF